LMTNQNKSPFRLKKPKIRPRVTPKLPSSVNLPTVTITKPKVRPLIKPVKKNKPDAATTQYSDDRQKVELFSYFRKKFPHRFSKRLL